MLSSVGSKDATEPSGDDILAAFARVGTFNRVAASFGFSRRKLSRLVAKYNLRVQSNFFLFRALEMEKHLGAEIDRVRVAQWITDEGSISVDYFSRTDKTILVVSGT